MPRLVIMFCTVNNRRLVVCPTSMLGLVKIRPQNGGSENDYLYIYIYYIIIYSTINIYIYKDIHIHTHSNLTIYSQGDIIAVLGDWCFDWLWAVWEQCSSVEIAKEVVNMCWNSINRRSENIRVIDKNRNVINQHINQQMADRQAPISSELTLLGLANVFAHFKEW